MNTARETKQSKVIELQLVKAATLLSDPQSFQLATYSLADYQSDLRRTELEDGARTLANLAHAIGCSPGFWRRMKEVAINLGNDELSRRFEEEFHRALGENL